MAATVNARLVGKALFIDGKPSAQTTAKSFAALRANTAVHFGAGIVARVLDIFGKDHNSATRKLVRLGGPGFLPPVPLQKIVWSNNAPPLSARVDELERGQLALKVSAALQAHVFPRAVGDKGLTESAVSAWHREQQDHIEKQIGRLRAENNLRRKATEATQKFDYEVSTAGYDQAEQRLDAAYAEIAALNLSHEELRARNRETYDAYLEDRKNVSVDNDKANREYRRVEAKFFEDSESIEKERTRAYAKLNRLYEKNMKLARNSVTARARHQDDLRAVLAMAILHTINFDKANTPDLKALHYILTGSKEHRP